MNYRQRQNKIDKEIEKLDRAFAKVKTRKQAKRIHDQINDLCHLGAAIAGHADPTTTDAKLAQKLFR